MGSVCYATKSEKEHTHTHAHKGRFVLYFNTHFYHKACSLVYCETRRIAQCTVGALNLPKCNLRIWRIFLNWALKTMATPLGKLTDTAAKLISRRYFNISLYERHFKFPRQHFRRPFFGFVAPNEQENRFFEAPALYINAPLVLCAPRMQETPSTYC